MKNLENHWSLLRQRVTMATKKKKVYKEISVGHDLNMSLDAWKYFIQNLITIHGKDAMLETDAGYNNVTLILTKEVKL